METVPPALDTFFFDTQDKKTQCCGGSFGSREAASGVVGDCSNAACSAAASGNCAVSPWGIAFAVVAAG
jgi:hypothetical protein